MVTYSVINFIFFVWKKQANDCRDRLVFVRSDLFLEGGGRGDWPGSLRCKVGHVWTVFSYSQLRIPGIHIRLVFASQNLGICVQCVGAQGILSDWFGSSSSSWPRRRYGDGGGAALSEWVALRGHWSVASGHGGGAEVLANGPKGICCGQKRF